jgi:hypothetical protein
MEYNMEYEIPPVSRRAEVVVRCWVVEGESDGNSSSAAKVDAYACPT